MADRGSRGHREGSARPERHQEQSQARLSASQAATLVQKRYGGKVMKVGVRQGGNGVVYSVKILQNSGHMRTILVDGQNGNILN